MVAGDHIIIPVQPEDFGAMGIIDVQESIARVQAGPNPPLHLLGYLLTMVSPEKTLHVASEETLRQLYGPAVFEGRFPEAIAYAESITRRMPIQQSKPKGRPAQDIMKLADEILGRIELATARGRMEVA